MTKADRLQMLKNHSVCVRFVRLLRFVIVRLCILCAFLSNHCSLVIHKERIFCVQLQTAAWLMMDLLILHINKYHWLATCPAFWEKSVVSYSQSIIHSSFAHQSELTNLPEIFLQELKVMSNILLMLPFCLLSVWLAGFVLACGFCF